MKLTNAAIIFVLVFCALFIPTSIHIEDLCELTKQNSYFNDVLDDAAFDVASCMVEYDSAGAVYINKDHAVDIFFQSLAAGFGISEAQARELSIFVPVILISCEDGFYISYQEQTSISSQKIYVRNWTDKMPFSTQDDDGYIYSFSLGEKKDYVRVFDSLTLQSYFGHYKDVYSQTNASCLADSEVFERVRKSTINDCIQTKMEYYINHHNMIAKRYGLSYSFYLPSNDSQSWLRSIDAVSFLYLFQGYPYNSGNSGYYNRVALAGAKVYKADDYVVDISTMTYHKKDCDKINRNFAAAYSSREECAMQGAYPCDSCMQ